MDRRSLGTLMGLAGTFGLIYSAGYVRPWWLTAPAILLSLLVFLCGAHIGTEPD